MWHKSHINSGSHEAQRVLIKKVLHVTTYYKLKNVHQLMNIGHSDLVIFASLAL